MNLINNHTINPCITSKNFPFDCINRFPLGTNCLNMNVCLILWLAYPWRWWNSLSWYLLFSSFQSSESVHLQKSWLQCSYLWAQVRLECHDLSWVQLGCFGVTWYSTKIHENLLNLSHKRSRLSASNILLTIIVIWLYSYYWSLWLCPKNVLDYVATIAHFWAVVSGCWLYLSKYQ